MINSEITEKITTRFGKEIIATDESYGMLSITVSHEAYHGVITFLRDDQAP